jgi:hypothetical protein
MAGKQSQVVGISRGCWFGSDGVVVNQSRSVAHTDMVTRRVRRSPHFTRAVCRAQCTRPWNCEVGECIHSYVLPEWVGGWVGGWLGVWVGGWMGGWVVCFEMTSRVAFVREHVFVSIVRYFTSSKSVERSRFSVGRQVWSQLSQQHGH